MFEHLRPFKKIIVTGPQRAGTTITAKMIAHDLGMFYIDEAAISVRDLQKMKAIVIKRNNFVLQCPSMVCHMLEFAHMDDVAIVMVKRDTYDIQRSQKRVGWNIWEESELVKFGLHLGDDTPPISVVKYDYWDTVLRSKVKNGFEVEYSSLRDHPMWVPATKRKSFGIRQTA